MVKKIGVLGLILGLTFLISLGSIMGADTLTLHSPAQDDGIEGTYILNATFDTNSVNNVTSVIFYYQITGGSWTTIATVENVTTGQIYFNYSWATTGIQDDNNIRFNASGMNVSDYHLSSDDSTSVDVDNGNPTCTISVAPTTNSKLYISATNTFTTSADATIGIDNCTMYFGSNTKVITASGDVCTTTSIPSVTTGSYYDFSYVVEDGNGNTTACTNRTYLVYPGDGISGNPGTSSTSDSMMIK